MIIDALLNLITGLVAALYALLPDWDILATLQSDSEFADPAMLGIPGGQNTTTLFGGVPSHNNPVSSLMVNMWHYNQFLPIDTFLSILSFGAAMWLVLIGYRIFKWIVGVVRGAGTT